VLDSIFFRRLLLCFVATGALAGGNEVLRSDASVPAADRWMYSFNATPGSRTIASSFSALPSDGGVDDRFGQFLVKFDTVAAGIPAGLGVESYDPRKVVFTAVLAPSENIPYDPTEDPRSSYGPSATADPDAGRPLELHGAGFRGGFTAESYQENSAFGSSAPGLRNAYALGFSQGGEARDVSHNVTLGFDALPWSVGNVLVDSGGQGGWLELAPGDPIPSYARAVFELDLSLPGVADYVRQSFHQGFIWLVVTSLHPVAQQAASGYPSFFTKEHPEQAIFGDVAPRLSITWSLPLKISHFSRDPQNGMVRLDWNAAPGSIYQVESTTDPASTVWTRHGPFTTSSPALLSWQALSPEPRAFFRITRSTAP
jgi:hypothetical protein